MPFLFGYLVLKFFFENKNQIEIKNQIQIGNDKASEKQCTIHNTIHMNVNLDFRITMNENRFWFSSSLI